MVCCIVHECACVCVCFLASVSGLVPEVTVHVASSMQHTQRTRAWCVVLCMSVCVCVCVCVCAVCVFSGLSKLTYA